MRVAVVGGGVSGLVSAYVLAKGGVEVVVYEKEEQLGGHANTVTIDGTSLDLGFMVFNRVSFLFSFIVSFFHIFIRLDFRKFHYILSFIDCILKGFIGKHLHYLVSC